MTVRHFLDPERASSIRQLLIEVRAAMETLDFDACDVDDVQDVVEMTTAELDRERPNVVTLGSYLNSIARSLRTEPRMRTMLLELDTAMREAQIPTNWEQ